MMRYVFELYTYAFATNDAAGFDPISAKDCTFCANVRSSANEHEQQRQVVTGGRITVESISAKSIGDDGFHSGRAVISQDRQETTDGEGAVVDEDSGGRFDVQWAMRWHRDRWVLLEVEASRAGDDG